MNSISTYVLFNQLKKGVTCNDLMVLSVGGNLGDNDGNDFLLEGNIVAEDVDRILVHIAKLVGLSLAQQQLDSITLAQVFLDHESLNFLFRL